MRFVTTYPIMMHPYPPEFVAKDGLIRFAQACERLPGSMDSVSPTIRRRPTGG